MELALFDLDLTLLDLDSDHAWGEFLIHEKLVDAMQHRQLNDQFYAEYESGTLDAVAYNEFVLSFLVGKSITSLNTLHEEFMQSVIRPAIRPSGLKALERHRTAGHEIVIITATNRFITAPIAQELGVQHLIATNPEVIQGLYTGKIDGEPCYRSGKLNHLNAWLTTFNNSKTLLESWGYSDSFNDIPLLEFVDHPHAITPDGLLRKHAQSNHWPIEDWSIQQDFLKQKIS